MKELEAVPELTVLNLTKALGGITPVSTDCCVLVNCMETLKPTALELDACETMFQLVPPLVEYSKNICEVEAPTSRGLVATRDTL